MMVERFLIFLLKNQPLNKTTSEIAKEFGTSQQTISRYLKKMEREGLIERTSEGIVVSNKGRKLIYNLFLELKSIFESISGVEGKIISGSGEGRYYLSIPEYNKPIERMVGFKPYLGTLNIYLSESEMRKFKAILSNLGILKIPGFKKGNRTFGSLNIVPCLIQKKIKGAVIIPERTHHPPNIIEVIAPLNLRKRLKKKDGSKISLFF